LIVGGSAVIAATLSPEALGQIKEEAPKPGEVSIAWYGQSMFQIVTPAGTRLLTDPQDIEAHRVPYVSGDLLLMTHFHTDHTTTPKVENIATIKQFNASKKTGPGPANLEVEIRLTRSSRTSVFNHWALITTTQAARNAVRMVRGFST
jgi:hypothetical protein